MRGPIATGYSILQRRARAAMEPRRGARILPRLQPLLALPRWLRRPAFRARYALVTTISRSYVDATWLSPKPRCRKLAASTRPSLLRATTSIFRGVSRHLEKRSRTLLERP